MATESRGHGGSHGNQRKRVDVQIEGGLGVELTCGEFADGDVLDALYAERQPERVVGQPVLLEAVPRAEGGAEGKADHLRHRHGQMQRLLSSMHASLSVWKGVGGANDQVREAGSALSSTKY